MYSSDLPVPDSAASPAVARYRSLAPRHLGPLLLPALLGVNALIMLLAGPSWYAHTPGVAATGPYNAHFVADIGLAFAAATVSLLMGLLPLPHARLFALPAAVFLIGHALLHLAGPAHHLPSDAVTLTTEIVGIYLPAWLSWRIVRRELPALAALIRTPQALVETAIRAAERRLGVSMDYARTVARTSPETFGKLLQLSTIVDHRHRDAAPLHLAGLAAAMQDDCGDCVQIHVNLARADGVAAEWLRAVLAQRLDDLPPPLADAVRFGRAVAADDPAMDDYRSRLERCYGAAMVSELAFAIGIARFYPSLKRGLGVARSCRLVTVEVGDG
jgi:AhpD family alkylhydroperoxidase